MSSQNLQLNNFNLQNSNFITEKINHEGIGLDIAEYKIPHRDGQKTVSYTYGTRPITIDGHISSTTASGLDGLLDSFKQNIFAGLATNLDIDYLGGSLNRRYSVNVKNVTIAREFYNTTIVPFHIDLECVNPPFGQDTATTTYYSNTAVSGTFYNTISGTQSLLSASIGGTINPQPTITFTVNVAGSMRNFQFINTTTNTAIFVQPTTISDGDVFVINTNSYSVTKNGSVITTYSGIYPTFQPGNNNFTLNVYGTGPNFTYQINIAGTNYYL